MRRKAQVLMIVGVILFSLFSWHPESSKAAAHQFATVNADTLYIRSNPSKNASIIGTLHSNQQVKKLGIYNGWSKVAYGTIVGWVSSEYLKPLHLKGYTTASTLNLRSQADETSARVGKIQRGSKVTIVSENEGWYHVQYGNLSGWVSKDYVTTQESDVQDSLDNSHSREAVAPTTKYVQPTTVNVRSKASTASTIIDVLHKNDQVAVIEEDGNWSKVQLANGQGWIASQYLALNQVSVAGQTQKPTGEQVTLGSNANLRTGPSTRYAVVAKGQAGMSYPVIMRSGDWMQVQLPDGSAAWVAGWLTSAGNTAGQKASEAGIQGKTIVLDAGHGGKDPGKIGAFYNEKDLTLSTALAVAARLQAAGAHVVFTRATDIYLPLEERVRISHIANADAFVSLHYNSALETSRGIMSFYYSESKDRALAQYIQQGLADSTALNDAGVHFGDFLVSRQNSNPAVLIELGFLSNPAEEQVVGTVSYREQVAKGITQGIMNYFKE
ncbi:MAG: SH3 domain-containing protein [Bacillus sp. (in: firmicutes)]